MDAVLAAVIDVGMEVALVGFDPLQLNFHKSPLRNPDAEMVGPAGLLGKGLSEIVTHRVNLH